MPLTPYSVSKGVFSRKAYSQLFAPVSRKSVTATATSTISAQSPSPAAASSVRGMRCFSLSAASISSGMGESTHSRVASAICGAALRRSTRYCADCSIVTRRSAGSSLSAAGPNSSISSLSRSSVVTPNRRLSCKILSKSGTDCAPSHLETDCRDTPSCCASSSCDQPAFLRSEMILSASIMNRSSSFQVAPILSDAAVAGQKPGCSMCQPAVAAGEKPVFLRFSAQPRIRKSTDFPTRRRA